MKKDSPILCWRSLSSVKFNLAIHKVCTLCLKDLHRHMRQKKFKAHNWTGFCWLFSTFPYILNTYLAWLTHSLFLQKSDVFGYAGVKYLSMTLLMISIWAWLCWWLTLHGLLLEVIGFITQTDSILTPNQIGWHKSFCISETGAMDWKSKIEIS